MRIGEGGVVRGTCGLAAGVVVVVVVCLAGFAFAGVAFARTTRLELPFSAGFGSFTRASGVAVDQASGNVFVADSGANEARVFGSEGGAPSGGIPSRLTGKDTPAGAFEFFSGQFPAGIAVDNACYRHGLAGGECASFDPSNGDVYMTDAYHSVVDKFRVNGANEYEYVCQFTGFGGFSGSACLKNTKGREVIPPEEYFFTYGVTVDREGDVYIAVRGINEEGALTSGRVFEYNSKGEEVRKVISELYFPESMSVDPKGDIYIKTQLGTRELVRSSFTGPVEGELFEYHEVAGLAFDQATNRLLLGFATHGVEYSETGKEELVFGSESIAAMQGMAVYEKPNEVYVSNDKGAKITVFGPPDEYGFAKTGPASNVHRTSVTVEGTVNPATENAEFAASCEVEYGQNTVTEAPPVACSPASVGTGEQPVPVTANLTGLTPGATYHYRIVAVNKDGPNPGNEEIVETPCVEGVSTAGASSVTPHGATLAGSLEPNEVETTYYFQYGESTSYGLTSPSVGNIDGANGVIVPASTNLAGLRSDTTYHYRLVATNKYGTNYGQDMTFLTTPGVEAQSAEFITQTSSILAARVYLNGSNTTYHFVYGPTAAYGLSIPSSGDADAGSSGGMTTVSRQIAGLQPGTTYHYTVVFTNAAGSTTGPDQTFTTLPIPVPTVTTGPASEVSQNSATLTGSVNPRGLQTSYEFDIGTDTTYGSRISGDAGSGDEAVPLTLDIRGLAAGALYHYRLVATNSEGTVYGADRTFTTPSFPTSLLVSPVGAPLISTPVFEPFSTRGASTITSAPKAKHKSSKRKTKTRKKPHGKAGKARRGVHGSGRGGR
jgi:hypothetical protein